MLVQNICIQMVIVSQKKKAQLMWCDAYRKAVLNVAKQTENQTRKSVDERKSVSYGKTHGESGSLSLETENPNALTAEKGKVEKSGKSETKYSIREEYVDEIESWEKDGMPKGETFTLGTTGDVLHGLGTIESDIYVLGDKIVDILNTHPEMTISEIKKFPRYWKTQY